ncbi:formylglycine-generating enzyme family protein [uncultured Thiodictyon sp.]|uniref:formylglycine-generating enzyme family protein n=1 Tax=uncultured Thiodictyon sp. TaxID=1846217 RepID=UPI003421F002
MAEVQPLPPIIEPKTALLAQAAPPTSAALTGAWSFRIGAFTRVLMIALAVVLGVAAFIVIRAAVTKRHSRLKMIALPGGMFWMGSPEDEPERSMDEGPRHQVRIAPFAIGKAAVTFAQYDAFCDATGRAKPADQGWGRDQHPVINVTWDDATAYAVWLSKKTGVPYRLPSEAEWEYAARAGTQTPFWTGPCINTDQANYDGNYDYNGCGAKTGVNRQQTVPVGSLPANPWGLHEVHGNVWEWVEDHSHYTYGGAPTDGSAWEAGGRRVVRGGSWHYSPRNLRSANRNLLDSGYRNNDLGFRVARTLSP